MRRVKRRHGVSGAISEKLLLFYKGTWPMSIPKRQRGRFGGSTWSNHWSAVPSVNIEDMPLVPIRVKEEFFRRAGLG
jgi:hypothetical protein